MKYICEVHLFRNETGEEKLVGHADLFENNGKYFIEFNNQRINAQKASDREFIGVIDDEAVIARIEE